MHTPRSRVVRMDVFIEMNGKVLIVSYHNISLGNLFFVDCANKQKDSSLFKMKIGHANMQALLDVMRWSTFG
jgi:hypothetical protein